MRITRAQALQIAVAVWGKTGAVRDYGPRSATTPGQRADASRELQELRLQKEQIEKLPGFLDVAKYPDEMTLGEFRAKYRVAKAALDAYRKLFETLQSITHRQRYGVGTVFGVRSLGFGMSIRATGDSWEDAFTKAGVSVERIEQILHPRKAAAKRAVAKLEAEAGAE